MTDRADYIGGSDIAAIMGVSPWRTAFDVWAEKTRDPSWQPQEETIQMRVGTYMEDFLADEYERETGRRVFERQSEYVHPTQPYLMGHVDGRIPDDYNIPTGVFEAKTAASDRGWADGVPDYYLTQVYFYLALTGAPWCDVAVLFPRGDFRIFRVEADEVMQKGVIAAAVAFHDQHLVLRKPPAIDTSESARRWLARMPDDEEDALEAGADLEEVIEKLAGVKTAAKALESTQELLENQAKILIGEHQKAVGRGWHVTYKRTKPFPQVDYKAATGALRIEMQLHGLADEADRAIGSQTKMVENRRPFILRKEDENG